MFYGFLMVGIGCYGFCPVELLLAGIATGLSRWPAFGLWNVDPAYFAQSNVIDSCSGLLHVIQWSFLPFGFSGLNPYENGHAGFRFCIGHSSAALVGMVIT